MRTDKITENLTFYLDYHNGDPLEQIDEGVLISTKDFVDGIQPVLHLGTGRASHVFAAIIALEEFVEEVGLKELYEDFKKEVKELNAEAGNE